MTAKELEARIDLFEEGGHGTELVLEFKHGFRRVILDGEVLDDSSLRDRHDRLEIELNAYLQRRGVSREQWLREGPPVAITRYVNEDGSMQADREGDWIKVSDLPPWALEALGLEREG